MSVQTQLEIRLPIALLSELHCLVSLDRGSSSTKLVLVQTDEEADADTFSIVFALAKNSEFDAALEWLAERCRRLLPPAASDGCGQTQQQQQQLTVALTGGGGALYRQKICDTLSAKPAFVDELVGQARGCAWLVSRAPVGDVFHDDPFLTPLDEDVSLPGLYVFSGSGNGLVTVHPDGSECQDHIMMHGGKAFLGHGALLLGTSDYDEIASLAEQGNTAALTANTASGAGAEFSLEPELLDRLSREDRALCLVRWFVQWSAYFVHHGIKTSGLTNIFLGCNFWRARVMRQLFASILRDRLAGSEFAATLKIRAFRVGHTGALGSMVTRPGDELAYIRDDGFCLLD